MISSHRTNELNYIVKKNQRQPKLYRYTAKNISIGPKYCKNDNNDHKVTANAAIGLTHLPLVRLFFLHPLVYFVVRHALRKATVEKGVVLVLVSVGMLSLGKLGEIISIVLIFIHILINCNS